MSSYIRVLVTGGAGFIGSHVVDRLVSEGFAVRVLDNLSSGKTANIESHLSSGAAESIEGDIRDVAVVKDSLKDVDAVIHLAALISVPYSVKHPGSTFDVNLAGTLNLLHCSVEAGVEKFVFASSCAVYGEANVLPVKETAPPNPISPYAESKLLGERYCLGFANRGLIEAFVLRFFNVYGCRQGFNEYSGVITRYIERVHRGDPLIVYGDGSQTRDFVNVKDVANAIVACTKNSHAKGRVLNVGSGKATSVNELAQTILELADAKLPISHEPPRMGDILHSYADISEAKKLLGYEPQVSLKDGLQSLLKEKMEVNQIG